MSDEIKYSVIVPVYNGEIHLEELCNRTKSVFEKINSPFEIVLVDDGSTDESWRKIKRLKEQNPEKVFGIKLSKNFGQHNATMCGFFHAKGDFIITMDDDLDTLPEEIPALIQKQKETNAALVYGISNEKEKINLKYFFSQVYKLLAKMEGSQKGKGSSFRLLTKNLVQDIKQNAGNFVLIDELCLWYTGKVSFAEVNKGNRNKKKSRYTLKNLFGLAGQQIIVSSLLPLKLMTFLGMFIALVNFLVGLRFIFKKIYFNVPLGYTSIIISILFSTGIILFCLGIIGEYLGRVVRASNKVPPFNIEEKI